MPRFLTSAVREDGVSLAFQAGATSYNVYKVGDKVDFSVNPNVYGSDELSDNVYFGFGAMGEAGDELSGCVVIKNGILEAVLLDNQIDLIDTEGEAYDAYGTYMFLCKHFEITPMQDDLETYDALFTAHALVIHEIETMISMERVRTRVMEALAEGDSEEMCGCGCGCDCDDSCDCGEVCDCADGCSSCEGDTIDRDNEELTPSERCEEAFSSVIASVEDMGEVLAEGVLALFELGLSGVEYIFGR
jgi:hypothetical protein